MLRRQAALAAAVIRLGEVRFDDSIDTAAVLVTGARVTLLFNRDFWDELGDAELAAVLIHEAMHVIFAHPARAQHLRNDEDRRLFTLACEAVINDIITVHFPCFPLPGTPITGPGLVGRSVHERSAEQVVALLRFRVARNPEFARSLLGWTSLDSHDAWVEGTDGQGGGWTIESDRVVRKLCARHARNDAYGSSPAMKPRLLDRPHVRSDLAQFLAQELAPSPVFDANWARPHRKGYAIYPDLVIPTHTPRSARRFVLVAIDASGSIPAGFLSAATAMAEKRIPECEVILITFDTLAYPFSPGNGHAMGGGGTRIQVVEEYARNKCRRYPDLVCVFTDGFSPTPYPNHPERWLWILPPWGTTQAIHPRSRQAFFEEKQDSSS